MRGLPFLLFYKFNFLLLSLSHLVKNFPKSPSKHSLQLMPIIDKIKKVKIKKEFFIF